MNNEPFDTLYPPPVFTFRLFRLGDNYSDTRGIGEADSLEKLEALLRDVQTSNEAVATMLDELATQAGIVPAVDEQAEGTEDMIGDKFAVMIECDTEGEQVSLLNRFQAEGIKCRSLIL